MTPRTTTKLGTRPTLDQALEGWWRVSDSPSGRILPDSVASSPERAPQFAAFDLHCWAVVRTALSAAKKKTGSDVCAKIAAHRCKTGSIAGLRNGLMVATHPDDLPLQPMPEHLEAVSLYVMARCTWKMFEGELNKALHDSEPFVQASVAEMV